MTQQFNFNDFPIETDQAIIDVTLPAGVHTLELVVEDSAGLRSAPSTVVITVDQAPPVITGITPNIGTQGSTVRANISGANLLGISQVVFAGTGVTARILPGGTNTSAPVEITMATQATLGGRGFDVTTPGGTTSSPQGVQFTVQQNAPVITGITPRNGRQGTIFTASIQGRNLSGATAVAVLGGGVTATIQQGGTDTNLPVQLVIAQNAAVSSRQFSVTTPGGQTQSPSTVTFTVAQAVPIIASISPNSGSQGTNSQNVTISGQNLSGATDLAFSGTGVTVNRITSSSNTRIVADIAIAAGAQAIAHTYTVTTPGGRATSPSGDEFTVRQAAPVITGITPASGQPGNRVNAVISGRNLSGARQVTFTGAGIIVNSISGSSDTSVSVSLTIGTNASPVTSAFTVVTPGGTARSPGNVVFTIQAAAPVISGIRPAGGVQGVRTMRVSITGQNLAGATGVTFQGTDIRTLQLVSSTDTLVTANITISGTAALTRRSFTVTTPAGRASSPRSVTFQVLAAAPTLRTINPVSAFPGQTINAVITGTNLTGATAINFSGTGVTGAISGRSTPTSVPITITVSRTAAAGARRFTIQTPQGLADSARFGLSFTVITIILPTFSPTIFPFTPIISATVGPVIRATVSPTVRPVIRATISPTVSPVIRATVSPTISPIISTTVQPILRATTLSPTISRISAFTTAASTTASQPVDAVSGIGPTSRARLEAGGINTIGDLANAQPTVVARLLRTTEVRARSFIDAARNL